MCLQELGLRAQNLLSILDSIVNIIEGDLYGRLMSARISPVRLNKIFIRASKIMRKMTTQKFPVNP